LKEIVYQEHLVLLWTKDFNRTQKQAMPVSPFYEWKHPAQRLPEQLK
jgi:hypothetical protein